VISVAIDENFFNVTLPVELEGQVLGLLGLFIRQSIAGAEQDIFVPLAVEYSGAVARSKFHLSAFSGELELVASYGDGDCGPELSYRYAR
jgi:hypothetical protein